jgi:hypothetical protein
LFCWGRSHFHCFCRSNSRVVFVKPIDQVDTKWLQDPAIWTPWAF